MSLEKCPSLGPYLSAEKMIPFLRITEWFLYLGISFRKKSSLFFDFFHSFVLKIPTRAKPQLPVARSDVCAAIGTLTSAPGAPTGGEPC